MSTDAREVSVELLRSLTPLEGMKRENLNALAKKVTVKQMSAGRTLFKEGDADKRTIWIVRGRVEVSEHGRPIGMIEGIELRSFYKKAMRDFLPQDIIRKQ